MKIRIVIFSLLFLNYNNLNEDTRIELLFNSPISFDSPKKQSSSKVGKSLLNLIDGANNTIHFAIYGMRNQPRILDALIRAKKRGVSILGIVDKDIYNNNYYSDTNELIKLIDYIKSDYDSDIRNAGFVKEYNYKPYWDKPSGFDGPPSIVGYSIDDKTAIISVQASKEKISFTGDIMHNKFFVFDNEIIWTGSTNISDSGTGGYNANVSALIKSKEIASLYIEEFNQMYYQGKYHNSKGESSNLIKYNKNSDVNVYFSPQTKVLSDKIIPLIEASTKSINVSVFFLTHKDVTGALIDAKRRGVSVKIIIDASGASNEYTKYEFLRMAGIPVKIENWGGKLHSKAATIDNKILILGSMNWTSAGENRNDENTILINDQKLATQFNSFFQDIWNSIPDKWLKERPSAESIFSVNSCNDGIDNDYDDRIDNLDSACLNKTNELNKLPPIYIVNKTEGSKLIKGNISKGGKKIYHLPNQKYYDKVNIDLKKGEYFFANEKEATKLGFRKSKI